MSNINRIQFQTTINAPKGRVTTKRARPKGSPERLDQHVFRGSRVAHNAQDPAISLALEPAVELFHGQGVAFDKLFEQSLIGIVGHHLPDLLRCSLAGSLQRFDPSFTDPSPERSARRRCFPQRGQR